MENSFPIHFIQLQFDITLQFCYLFLHFYSFESHQILLKRRMLFVSLVWIHNENYKKFSWMSLCQVWVADNRAQRHCSVNRNKKKLPNEYRKCQRVFRTAFKWLFISWKIHFSLRCSLDKGYLVCSTLEINLYTIRTTNMKRICIFWNIKTVV